jgi:regulator of nonsense transcripts 2
MLILSGGPPIPGRLNHLDMPDDFFRIRLVATLLETCGIYFSRGAAGKKLDYFLSFFQVGDHFHSHTAT